MRSTKLIPFALAIAGLAFSSAIRAQIPTTSAGPNHELAHPWAMRHANVARTGQSPALGAQTGQLAWKRRVAGVVPQFAVSADEQIWVGGTFNENWWSEEVYVTLLDARGNTAARTRLIPYSWGFSQGIASSPALGRSGAAVVPSTNAQLVKYDRLLNPLWTYQENTSTINDSSPAVLADGSVRHLQELALHALREDGTLLWKLSGVGGSEGSVAVAPNGDMAAGNDYIREPHVWPMLWYVNADGTLRWVLSALHGGNGSTPVFAPDGTLYYGSVAFDPTNGAVRWSDGFSGQTPALDAKNHLVALSGSQLRSYDATTGAIRWTVNLAGSGVDAPAIDRRGVIYVTMDNGDVAAVDPGGSLLWQIKVCDRFGTSPVIGPEEMVIAYGTEGFEKFIYAIR